MINGRPGLFSLRYVGIFGLAGILHLLYIYTYPLLFFSIVLSALIYSIFIFILHLFDISTSYPILYPSCFLVYSIILCC